MLPDALHSIRSLLCKSTNSTPHERFLSFPRKSVIGKSLPSWLTSTGPVLLRRFVRQSKSDPLCDEVELLEANPNFAHVRLNDGRETTVALKDLAPCPTTATPTVNTDPEIAPASSPIPSSEIAPASSDPTTSNTSSSLPQSSLHL